MTHTGDEKKSGETARGTAARHWRRSSKMWPNILIAVLAAGVAGVFVLAGAMVRLEKNLQTTPLDLSIETETETSSRPTGDDEEADVDRDPLQILIIGSDTRSGNREYGTEADSGGGGQADVMMLLHLSADRKRATVLSFPRDLVMPLPACKDPETGRSSPAMDPGQLSSTLQVGPGCTAAAINAYTKLKVDHLMVADFNAVKEISRIVGGVEVCVTNEVDDPKSGLVLPAGVSTVKGNQALAFLRTRAAFADGSDIARISAQQSFLASLARKVTQDSTLEDLPRLYSIAEAITQNLTTDEDLGRIPRLVRLADRLRSVDVADIEFITVPNEPWEQDPNRVQLIEKQAQRLFDALIHDTPLNQPNAEQDETGPAPQNSSPAVDIEPSLVPVTVRNASGEAGRGSQIQERLAAEGFTQALVRASPGTDLPVTQVFYNYGWNQAASVVAATLGVPAQQVLHSERATAVEVSVGTDFREGHSPAAARGVADGLQGQTAEQVTCQPVR